MKAKATHKLGVACLLALTLAGCYKHSFTVGSGGNVSRDPTYSDNWASHWFFGLIGETNVNVKDVCPSGNATIKDEHSFLNGLVTALIGIIWDPTTVEVYCGDAGKTASFQLTPQQMRKIALNPDTLVWAQGISRSKAAELQSAVEAFEKANRNVAAEGAATRF